MAGYFAVGLGTVLTACRQRAADRPGIAQRVILEPEREFAQQFSQIAGVREVDSDQAIVADSRERTVSLLGKDFSLPPVRPSGRDVHPMGLAAVIAEHKRPTIALDDRRRRNDDPVGETSSHELDVDVHPGPQHSVSCP